MANPLERVPLDQVSIDHLRALLDDGVREGRRLDYKAELYPANDEGSREFLRDVVSFANADGGHLVLGITEENGVPAAIDGVDFDPDTVIPKLDSKIQSSIDPRILKVTTHPVRVGDHRFVLVLRIPRSWNRPHMVTFKGLSQCWARNNGGKYQMDMTEIRAQVLGGSAIADRLAMFLKERVQQIAADTGPIELGAGPKIILHCVPFAALELTGSQSLPDRKTAYDFLRPLGHRMGLDVRVNFDGLLGFNAHPTTAYAQLFRRGVVETVNADMIAPREGEKQLPGEYVDRQVEEVVERLAGLLRGLDVSPPMAWVLTLIGVKGYEIVVPNAIISMLRPVIDRDELAVPEVIDLDMTMTSAAVAKALMDPVWQAGGWDQSRTFQQQSPSAGT